jgi:opacity protein-like surface antigen
LTWKIDRKNFSEPQFASSSPKERHLVYLGKGAQEINTLTMLVLRPRLSLFTLILFLACFLAVLGNRSGLAQTEDQTPHAKKFTPETDVSFGAYGQLTETRMPTTTYIEPAGVLTMQFSQSTSPSPGVFGTFHQSFKPWLGYNVNFGYTRFSENYSYGETFVSTVTPPVSSLSSFAQGSLRTNMYDLTIAYVFEGPRNKRFSTFGQFGGGGLFFLPPANAVSAPYSTVTAKNQTRPAMVFGVGMNYKLTNHLALRAEYRGFFYKSPDFNLPPYGGGESLPMTRLFTVTSEPAVSLVYRFGGTKIHQTSAKSN